MTLTVSPTLTAVMNQLGAFLTSIVPAGTPVLRGPIDRAASPNVDYVLMTPVFRTRLRTNLYTDNIPNTGDGSTDLEQGTQLEVQVDFYGDASSGDWCAEFTTVFRSEAGSIALAPICQPLYADDGRMLPLVTGEEQFLERWMVRAVLQYNPVTSVVTQYADALNVVTISVDKAYPPT
jgi:hypothetical protein